MMAQHRDLIDLLGGPEVTGDLLLLAPALPPDALHALLQQDIVLVRCSIPGHQSFLVFEFQLDKAHAILEACLGPPPSPASV